MIRRAAILVLGSGVWAAANGAAALIATAFLAPEDRGHMVIVLAVASLVSAASGLGTGIAFRMYYPKAADAGGMTFTYWFVSGLLCLLSASIGSLAAWLLGIDSFGLLLASAVSSIALLFSLQLSEFRFGLGEFQSSALWAAGAGLAGLVGILWAVSADGDSADLLLLQNVLIICVCVVNFLQLCKSGKIAAGGYTYELAKLLLLRGFSPLIWTLGILVLSRVDRLVLAKFEGAEVVAIYALSVTLSEIVRMFPTAFSQFVTREMALGASSRIITKYIVFACASAIVVGIVSVPSAYFLVATALDPVYLEAIPLLVVLLAGEVAMALYLSAARGLQGLGDASSTARLGSIVALLALPCYAVGAGLFGSIGVAVVLSSCYFILGSFSALLLRARLRQR